MDENNMTAGEMLRETQRVVHETLRGWRCERCGKPLPTQGMVWSHRRRSWNEKGTSGFYCDACASARERGIDE